MKQAEHCGFSSKPTLNQTGELNAASWLTRIAFSSASNVSASSSLAKYPAVAAPGADGADDAPDHVLDRALALRARHATAEVLLRHDVGRGLRPELRELDVLLLERRPVLARNVGIADLPLDLVIGVAALDREQATDGEGGVLVDDAVHELVGVDFYGVFLLYGRHFLLFFPT